MSSCVKNSSEYKALLAKSDSLAIANAKNQGELDEILSLLNEVEENFNSIKTAENYLTVQSNASGELTPSVRERVRSDMQFVTETLKANKEKIAELEKKLKNSSINSSKLQSMVNNLREELDQKTLALVTLNEELKKKNEQIDELSKNVTDLSKNLDEYKEKSDRQQETIAQQQLEINTVFYCFGTTKELKEQNILVDGKLGANFNKNYFIKVRDYNSLQNIRLYAKKGKLISAHPDGTYEFTKDPTGQVQLTITNPALFWSLTKYLVVQVNV
jgi:chromosome segregation ATPase